MLQQLRPFLRIEAALAAVVALVAVAGYLLYQKLGDTRDQQVLDELRLSAIRRQVTALQTSDEKASLQEQIAQLRASLDSVTLPSRQKVLDLSTALATDAATRGLQVTSFQSTEVKEPVGGVDYSAIEYALKAQGLADNLVGLLTPMDVLPTVVMKDLLVTEAPQAPGQWVMEMRATVIYAQEGT